MAYHPRSAWRRRQPKRVVPHPVTSAGSAVSLLVMHHTVGSDGPFFPALQSVESQHINGRYDDFAYNGAVSAVEPYHTDGRGPTVLGGATGNGVDSRSLSIVALGDFHNAGRTAATDLLVSNTADLIVRWIKVGHVSPSFTLDPHRRHYATACCGDRLVNRLPDITKLVATRLGEEDVRDYAEWWRYYNKAKLGEYHPVIEFIQRGLKSYGLYRGNITGRKNARTLAGWTAFEKSVKGTNNDEVAGPASWKLFTDAVFAESAEALSPELRRAINEAVRAVKALEDYT